MCCRLQLDLRDLKMKTGGLFGSGEQTGSVGVVTMNLARLGHVAKTKEEFFERLERLMWLSRESLEIKRKEVQKNMNNGLLPYTKRYLGNLDGHFCTIGLNGMNEAALNFMQEDIASPGGKQFAKAISAACIQFKGAVGSVLLKRADRYQGRFGLAQGFFCFGPGHIG